MSFREKSTWITFVLVLIVFLFWLQSVFTHTLFGHNAGLGVVLTLIAFVVAEIVLHLAIALQSPAEARAPKDERERLIDLKACRVGFYVLAVGVWAGIGSMHIKFSLSFVVPNLMAAFFIAELAKLGTQLVLYRRDR